MPEARPAPLAPPELAAREWPPLRAWIVDIAAALDRLDAAGDAAETARVRADAEALLQTVLAPGDGDRAERVLAQLSRPYEPNWRETFGRK